MTMNATMTVDMKRKALIVDELGDSGEEMEAYMNELTLQRLLRPPSICSQLMR